MVSLPFPAKPDLSNLKPARGEYCRLERLPGLLKLWPGELDDYSYPGTLKTVALLRKALRVERSRALSGHWAYDLSRHLGLADALRYERERLQMLERGLSWRADSCKAPRRGNASFTMSGKIGKRRDQLRFLMPPRSWSRP